MFSDELKKIETDIKQFEENDLNKIEGNTSNLKRFAAYASTTETEQKIIENSELIGKSLIMTNDINSKLCKSAQQITGMIEKIEKSTQNAEIRIDGYQTKMETIADDIITSYKTSIIEGADSSIKSLMEKQNTAFDKCIFGLNEIREANSKILSAQNDYSKSLSNLKDESIKSVKKWTTAAGIVLLFTACILAAASSAAVLIVFSLIPKISEMLYAFWTVTGIVGVLIIVALLFLVYCFISGKKGRW